jgi:hypothetical protein
MRARALLFDGDSPKMADPLAPRRTSSRLRRGRARLRAPLATIIDHRPASPDIGPIASSIATGTLQIPCAGEVKQEIFSFSLTTPSYVFRLLPPIDGPAT